MFVSLVGKRDVWCFFWYGNETYALSVALRGRRCGRRNFNEKLKMDPASLNVSERRVKTNFTRTRTARHKSAITFYSFCYRAPKRRNMNTINCTSNRPANEGQCLTSAIRTSARPFRRGARTSPFHSFGRDSCAQRARVPIKILVGTRARNGAAANQAISQPAGQPTNQPAIQPANQPAN